ncbi:hypothetical protein [Corynebacterium callunae]|uniref:hypothetical protein n=1 Tax=Corynebacterium callunae TaxID=1721 RepID=UPI001FFF2FCF|nr:hypothetical protein [Corynebacterium callunae]MCK2200184.1 hypothetical protein [Corynebacterium callunae]
MAKIREDFEGVVHVHAKSGTVVLRAGEVIPRGVKVGAHLIHSEQATEASEEADPNLVGEANDEDVNTTK